jgi:hypothetical protein
MKMNTKRCGLPARVVFALAQRLLDACGLTNGMHLNRTVSRVPRQCSCAIT